MRTRSWLAIALVGGLAVAGSAASGALAKSPQSAEVVELSLLDNSIKGGKNEAAATWIEDTLIPAFEAEMEAAGTPVNVTFEGRGVDDEDYKSQLALDIGAGEGPDVFSMDGIWVGEFATAEYIMPLADIVGPEVEEWDGWAQINEAIQANGMFDGARYGVPQGSDGRVIYFNKELFEQAGLPADWQPATMEEVLEAARALKEALPDVIPIQLNGGVAMGEATTMQGALPLLAAAGAPVYDETTGLWTGATPEMIEMLGTYATIYGDEALGDVEMQLLQDGRDASFEGFANGEIGMLIEGDYLWRSVINPETGNFPMATRDEAVGWAMIPAYEAGGALGGFDGASMSGGGVWAIGANTEHPAEAWAMLVFMNSAEQVTAGLSGQARITARDDVNAEVLTGDPLLSYMAEEILPVTHYRPALAEYPTVSIALQEAVEAVVSGASPEDAAADYQAALEEIVGADAVNGG
ncbi:MAG: extracellular solute-binding protein [Nocardioidaceae bacterium]|nr:extracellular solute-binding protein [Nocardioidaceae bacterium]